MTIQLAENNYGNSRIHFLRVTKQAGRHDVRELSLSIRFEGDFAEAHIHGDNRKILPPDTMKNTVYALARQHSIEPLENFAIHLMDHFLTYNPQVTRVLINAEETIWTHLPHGAKPHPSAFSHSGNERRIASLSGSREGTQVRAGIKDLVVLKTTKAAFQNFKKDPYTTLQEEADSILSTTISANWLYTEDDAEFGPLWHAVRRMLLETFTDHESRSLQHTLYAMGQVILENFENVSEIELSLPSHHFQLIDLNPLGMDNPGMIFLPQEEPTPTIQATLRKI
jgi:urate oxidase